MELHLGKSQRYTSTFFRKYPKLAPLVQGLVGYTNLGNYARFDVFQRIIKRVPLTEDARILDLGTGYGEYALGLADAMPRATVHALDISVAQVQAVRRAVAEKPYPNVVVHHAYLEDTNLQDLDFVFSVDVFEHIAPEQMPFATVWEKLRPGGYFMVKIPNVVQRTLLPERWFDEHADWLEDEHIGQVYNLAGLINRMGQEGFQVRYASYSDGWLSRLAWELAYLAKKVGWGTQLLSLPLAKGLVWLDRKVHHNRWGNAIQVIGQKPYED